MKQAIVLVLGLCTVGLGTAANGQDADEPEPYITTSEAIIVLSANDGEMRFKLSPTGGNQESTDDSITVNCWHFIRRIQPFVFVGMTANVLSAFIHPVATNA